MNKLRSGLCVALAVAGTLAATAAVNYDEAKVSPYELEDPLTFASGVRVTSPDQWPARRAEILGIFAKEMYGQEPPKPETVAAERILFKTNCAELALCSVYRMGFRKDGSGPKVDWILLMPRHAPKPVPVVLQLNYGGNHQLVSDADIPVPTVWFNEFGGVDGRADPSKRGWRQDSSCPDPLPIGSVLARGYAVLSACYQEVSPDPSPDEKDPAHRQDPFAYTGCFELWGPRDSERTDNTSSLGAWAWALSRGLDLAERIPEIDARRCVVTGNSRLGKAALLAAARDERFAVCVVNQAGGGGATLAKRDFGENIGTEMRMFPHWYCKAYAKYADKPWKSLTFDQHLLVAAVAPRALLIQGFNSPWFDTKGEYLACRAAAPVWRFLGRPTMPDVPFPENFTTTCIGGSLGYVRREGLHGISDYDWIWLLDFADRAFCSEGKVVITGNGR